MAVELPSAEHAAALADWAELTVMTSQDGYVSAEQLTRLLRSDGTENAEEEMLGDLDRDEVAEVEIPRDEDDDIVDDARVELLFDEIRFRRQVGERLYPFAVADQAVVRAPACGEQVYLLLLVLSAEGSVFRAEGRAHEVEATYDAIALLAMRRYLGRGAVGVRFARDAADADDPETRPTSFPEAIDWLRQLLSAGEGVRNSHPPDEEDHWESERRVAQGRPPLRSYSDAGVDVVAWWHFTDGRGGAPVLLAQCTVQRRWERKLSDIDVNLWGKWIDFKTVPPQTALVIPFAERLDDPTWENRTVTAGVIVDRRRLLELLGELECEPLEALLDENAVAWLASEIESLA